MVRRAIVPSAAAFLVASTVAFVLGGAAEDQHGRLDVHLDVPPEVQCDVVPVSAGEDREENGDHHPEQGLQELH